MFSQLVFLNFLTSSAIYFLCENVTIYKKYRQQPVVPLSLLVDTAIASIEKSYMTSFSSYRIHQILVLEIFSRNPNSINLKVLHRLFLAFVFVLHLVLHSQTWVFTFPPCLAGQYQYPISRLGLKGKNHKRIFPKRNAKKSQMGCFL